MKVLFALALTAVLLLAAGSAGAFPSLYLDGNTSQEIVAMAGPHEDLSGLSFDASYQDWTLMAEFAGWKAKNNFGFYTDPSSTSIIFPGSASAVTTVRTNIAAGQEIGLYHWADLGRTGGDPHLYSDRAYTTGTEDPDYQFFAVYDIRAYRGMGHTFNLVNNANNRNFTVSTDYDYLIYVDDSGAGPDYDHNDMIMGVSAVPEPTTMLLFGLGLAGTAALRRRKQK